MLSREDKQDIQNLIIQIMTAQVQKQTWQQQKEDPHKGATQSEREKIKQQESRNERREYLQKLRDKDKDNLAQRIEYEKLRLLDNIPNSLKTAGTVAKTGGRFIGNTAKELGTLTGDVLGSVTNSKLGKSITQSILYSNPLTAMIAMNSGLIGGAAKGALNLTKFGFNTLKKGGSLIGKGADWLYRKTRNPINDEESSASDLLEQKESISTLGGTNYISTKKATFLGGTNNILILNGKSGGAFSLNLPTEEFQSISSKKGNKQLSTQPIALLPDKQLNNEINTYPLSMIRNKKDDDIIEMTKGINGIYAQTQATTKILNTIAKKQLLIAGGVLLAVGALFLAVKLLKDKFNQDSNRPSPGNQMHNLFDDYKKLKETPQKLYDEIAKLDFAKPKTISNNRTKLGNNQIKIEYDKAGDLVPSPVTGSILTITPSKTKTSKTSESEYSIKISIARGSEGEKVLGLNITVHHVQDALKYVYEGKKVNKGDPIGIVGEGLYISIDTGAGIGSVIDERKELFKNVHDYANTNAEKLKNKQIKDLQENPDNYFYQMAETQKQLQELAKKSTPLTKKMLAKTVYSIFSEPGDEKIRSAAAKYLTPEISEAYSYPEIPSDENKNPKIKKTPVPTIRKDEAPVSKTVQESKDTQKQIDKAKEVSKKTEDNKSNNSNQTLSFAPKQSNNIFFSPATTPEEKIRHADITSLYC